MREVVSRSVWIPTLVLLHTKRGGGSSIECEGWRFGGEHLEYGAGCSGSVIFAGFDGCDVTQPCNALDYIDWANLPATMSCSLQQLQPIFVFSTLQVKRSG